MVMYSENCMDVVSKKGKLQRGSHSLKKFKLNYFGNYLRRVLHTSLSVTQGILFSFMIIMICILAICVYHEFLCSHS